MKTFLNYSATLQSFIYKARKGFTLAELLIAVAILVSIATFTIPKILTSVQNQQSLAKAKEAASIITAAYQQLQQNGLANASTNSTALIPYILYASYVTTGAIDGNAQGAALGCDASDPCLKLHNGSMLRFNSGSSFWVADPAQIIDIMFDPDGVYSGVVGDGPSKSVQFELHYNGKLETRGNLSPGTKAGGTSLGGVTPYDPSWFSWN